MALEWGLCILIHTSRFYGEMSGLIQVHRQHQLCVCPLCVSLYAPEKSGTMWVCKPEVLAFLVSQESEKLVSLCSSHHLTVLAQLWIVKSEEVLWLSAGIMDHILERAPFHKGAELQLHTVWWREKHRQLHFCPMSVQPHRL